MANVRDTSAPEKGLPSVDWSALSFTGDGTAFSRSFRYVHRRHTLQDLLRPGYWNPVPSFVGKKEYLMAIDPWDEIAFCVGGPDPFDATRGILVIGKKPALPGDDVIVGLVSRDTTTPAGHDGTLDKSKQEKAA